MFYARLADGTRALPTGKEQRATCPNCGEEVIGKYGQIVAPHWAHRADRECDAWGEHEGPWHLGWKALVVEAQCEVTMKRVIDGVEHHHRADVVGDRGVVIELQHSSISVEDIQARESFYGRMVWVFDASYLVGGENFRLGRILDDEPVISRAEGKVYRKGCTLPSRYFTDKASLIQAWESSIAVRWYYPKRSLWATSKPVYLDFGRPVKWAEDDILYRADECVPMALQASDEGPSMMRVQRFTDDEVCGSLIHREEFLRRHLYLSLKDEELRQKVLERALAKHRHVVHFRRLRHEAFEWKAEKARVERENAELARRERERVEEERRRAVEESQRKQALQMEELAKRLQALDYNNVIQLVRRVNRNGGFDRAEAEVYQQRIDALESKMWDQIIRLDEAAFEKAKVATETQIKTHAATTPRYEVKVVAGTEADPQDVVVKGPYNYSVVCWCKEHRFKWNSAEKTWAGHLPYGSASTLAELRDVAETANRNHVLERLPPKLAFFSRIMHHAIWCRYDGNMCSFKDRYQQRLTDDPVLDEWQEILAMVDADGA
jgi:hypothetical protein